MSFINIKNNHYWTTSRSKATRKLHDEICHLMKFAWVYYTANKMKCWSHISLTCLKANMMSLESSISLNMPSSLLVNPGPHSCFSLLNILFSASTLADFPTSSLFARSCQWDVITMQPFKYGGNKNVPSRIHKESRGICWFYTFTGHIFSKQLNWNIPWPLG